MRHHKGVSLPGSSLYCAADDGVQISASIYSGNYFGLSCYCFSSAVPVAIHIKEARPDLRIELALSGYNTLLREQDQSLSFKKAYWRLSNNAEYSLEMPAASHFVVFSVNLSPNMLEKLGMRGLLEPLPPNLAPVVMMDLARELIKNPYSTGLRNLYYEHSVRRMLFYHLTTSVTESGNPEDRNKEKVAPAFESDYRLMDADLLKLKKNYRQIFRFNVFDRLMQRRMDHAKQWLEETDLSVDEIAHQTGYDSVSDFISSFRKKFGYTPREMKKMGRGGG